MVSAASARRPARRRRLGGTTAFLVFILTGCLEFTSLEPERSTPSRLQLLVLLQDGSPPITRASGQFRFGSDAAGARTLAREEIGVGGILLPPIERSRAGLRYDSTWEAGLDGTEIVLEGVRLAGVPGAPEVRLPIVWRAGPDSLVLSPDEDLVLPLRVSTALPREEVVRLHWGLFVRRLGEDGDPEVTLLTLNREGIPPERLRIPAEWLSEAGRPLRVELVQDAAGERDASEAGYLFRASLRGQLTWHVARP